jgi:putative ABC transport system permease protein
MRFMDLVRLIFDNLGRRKGRVALTAIGVVIGTASVILLVSLAIGLQRSATSQLWGISDLKRIDVYPGWSEVNVGPGPVAVDPMTGMPPGVKLLTPATVEEIRAIPGVGLVSIRQTLSGGALLKYGRMETWPWIQGVDVDDLSAYEFKAQVGTTQLERGTAVVGAWVLKNFYDPRQRPGQEPPPPPTPEEIVGQQLKLEITKWAEDGQPITRTYTIRIAGVLEEARGEQDGAMFVRLDELIKWEEWVRGKRVNFNKEGYNQLLVRAEDPAKVVEIADQINALGYQASTPQSFVEGINSFFIVLQLVFGGIGAISLLVAAIGIANTMTMAILERTREIGLMKAIGATNRDVLSIFLGESAGIGLIGGIGGVILGWGGSYAINFLATTFLAGQSNPYGGLGPGIAAATPVWLPIFALVFSTLVGLISGLYPSLQAATLVPVNALKYE